MNEKRLEPEKITALYERLSRDVLFYPEMPKIEQQTKQLLCKFAACTEEERALLLKTIKCKVEKMQDQHKNANKNIK